MDFPTIGGGSKDNGGLYIRLKDGERVRGVFRGNPKVFYQHWVNNRSVICPGKANCELCAGGDKAKFRFKINFLTQVDDIWVAKIFEQGFGVFKEMKEMHEQEYNLEKTCLTLARSGEGTETRYRLTPVKNNGGMKDEDFDALSAIPLNDLTTKAPGQGEDDSDIPF